MKAHRVLRGLAWLGIGALGTVALLATTVWGISEWRLRRTHDVPLRSFAAASGGDSAEGRRRAILIGCLNGCHGVNGVGGMVNSPPLFRVAAPTLPAVLAQYTDAELERLARFGVKRDGKTALGMPSGTFYPISDADLSVITTVLRQLPATPAKPRVRDVYPVGRLAIALGKLQVSADQVDSTHPRWGALPLENPEQRGRYTASITCSECHGLDLQGIAFMKSPALAPVVRGYSLEEFRHLLRTGQPTGGRTLGLMGRVAARDFVYFSDQEINDLYAYLRSL